MTVLSVVLSALAFLCFAFCSKSYYRQLAGQPRPVSAFWLLQLGAWLLLLASLWPLLQRWPFEIALVTWLGLISLSALIVAAVVNYAWPLFALLWRVVARLGGVFPGRH